jgi:1-deoxy-D-xylulose-5-phosphate reductoisomerase
MGAVMNAANEVAVEAFIAGKIRFGEICSIVERTISDHRLQTRPDLDDLLDADAWAREAAKSLMNKASPSAI